MVSCSSLSNSRFSSESPLRISGLAFRTRGAEADSDEALSPLAVPVAVEPLVTAAVAFGFAQASKDDCCLGAGEAEEVVFLVGPSFAASESAGRLFMFIVVVFFLRCVVEELSGRW